MPERSVSAMRAMFEAKGENTSPPSRGRSPAGSERSAASRNVSNMRSSFVAVEKSGMLGLRRVSDADQPADGASPSQRGRNPLSRNPSLSHVQEEEGGLGTILKGSPFEDSKPRGTEQKVTAGAGPKQDNKLTSKRADDANPAPMQKITNMVQATANKFKATAPLRDQGVAETKPADKKPAEQKLPPIATNKPVSKEKGASGSAKTPTSASRTGPALKVSSPSTTTPAAKPAPRKLTEPQGPKLSTRSSRPSLSQQEARAKSPAKAAAIAKPRVSDAASLRPKQSRPSLAGTDPDFLNRMSRPTAASAKKVEKDAKPEEKKPRQSMGRAPDSGFLDRMMRPTQASANKHQEDQTLQKPAPKNGSASNSQVLERLMKPTQASALKHEREAKAEEAQKASRNSIGGRPAEPGLLERMMRPTAASSSKHHEKAVAPAEEPKMASPPRTKTQIVAAALKPKKAVEAIKSKVEEKTSKGSAKDEDVPASNVAPSVAPEQTQSHIESTRPMVERVETEKVDGVPHLSAAAALQATEEQARAKRTIAITSKQSSRDSAIEAATTGAASAVPVEGGKASPVQEKPVNVLEQEQAAAAKSGERTVPAVEPAPKVSAADHSLESEAAISLASQDTKVQPPTEAASAGAGEAPGPALKEGAQVVKEAVKEVREDEKKQEAAQDPSLAETVATVT